MEEIKCKGNREIESYQFTKMELEMELLLFARNMNAEIWREQREELLEIAEAVLVVLCENHWE